MEDNLGGLPWGRQPLAVPVPRLTTRRLPSVCPLAELEWGLGFRSLIHTHTLT